MEAQELLKRFELVKRYTEGNRDFTGINLNEANLSRINLSGSILRRASLFVTNISGANLSEADLSEANLNVARLSSTNLSRAILNGATLNVANLVRADLSGSQLIGASLIRGELVRCELSQSNFSGANLTEADLREVKLTEANLSGANLSGANLRGALASSANFQGANLHGADLTKAELNGVNFSNADLRQASLQQVNFSGADLSGANLKWADLSGANLKDADLSDAKLSGANLNGADLRNTNLANTNFVHADLTETNLINADWVGADLTGATLTGARLYLVPRFGIIADNINCEWVDLSPDGDRTLIQQFNSPSEARKFLNHRPGLVRIVVNAVLDYSANIALATAYSEIARHYPAMSCPPDIEVGYRRTTLTFRFDSDEHLLPAAFLGILPFNDALETQKNIVAVSKNIGNQDLKNNRVVQLCKALNLAINNLNEATEMLQTVVNSARKTKFFQSPTQTILISSGQESLTVYSHQNFGRRGGKNQESKFSLPAGEKIVDFLASFDYLD
ncbi:pentapeptide repeat-containing protein [Microcoleus sp. LEGE 07076]|uniref:pentapeptide repeat-containing protein n=1 Tax=Microcoleus sp. LEGE 07076 TaxID=915322 RepID=UPI00187FF006|nr:pentapeptide repeat-containing protein [Microcoleus sp. LEGE 07076]MBE9187265.1 pentapeptide repeat-containing protein [Microcoleus sp. LEGE 07076]